MSNRIPLQAGPSGQQPVWCLTLDKNGKYKSELLNPLNKVEVEKILGGPIEKVKESLPVDISHPGEEPSFEVLRFTTSANSQLILISLRTYDEEVDRESLSFVDVNKAAKARIVPSLKSF